MKSPKRIVVTLDPEQRAALDKINKATGAPLAHLIREAIDKMYLKGGKKK